MGFNAEWRTSTASTSGTISPRRRRQTGNSRQITLFSVTLVSALLAVNYFSIPPLNKTKFSSQYPSIRVFSSAENDIVATHNAKSVHYASSGHSLAYDLELAVYSQTMQRAYVKEYKCGLEKFDDLVNKDQDHLAAELWKYCALRVESKKATVVFLDITSPLLVNLEALLERALNVAVLADKRYPQAMHGSLVILQRGHSHVAEDMLQHLAKYTTEELSANPLLLSQRLFASIEHNAKKINESLSLRPGENGNWFLLEQRCYVESQVEEVLRKGSVINRCPSKSEFCCSIYDSLVQQAVMATRYLVHPFQKISEDFVCPYEPQHGYFTDSDLPYITTVQEEVYQRSEIVKDTPNFFQILEQADRLPSETCLRTLRLKRYDEDDVAKRCSDYTRDVCSGEFTAPPKFVSKTLTILPPRYRRDPRRLIPRIIHQTWYEILSEETYPNMSRLAESFRKSGYEYKFYSDDDAESFLRTHFPPEVLEAYKALIPGAFKADLFRYCALLIYGGVYADVDILLESNLDKFIAEDIGFMLPKDEPEACVWQGFIASAPGHPFLANAIETIVNQVRNRFTSVDFDVTFCPYPNYKVLHMFDVLFTAGPCLLGASINRVLGRHGQTPLQPGELLPDSDEGTLFVKVSPGFQGAKIPGRTIILKQNKWDMGAHRFTMVESNSIVAVTSLPNSDDRQNVPQLPKVGPGSGGAHYSKAHAKSGHYGLNGLYVDQLKADEDIRIVIDLSRHHWIASPLKQNS